MRDEFKKKAHEVVSRWVHGYAINNTPGLIEDVAKAIGESVVCGMDRAADIVRSFQEDEYPCIAATIEDEAKKLRGKMTLKRYKEQLQERIKVAEAAIPGPWFVHHFNDTPEEGHFETEEEWASNDSWSVTREEGTEGWSTDAGHPGYGLARKDAALFAQAGTHYLADLRALLAAIEALEVQAQDYVEARVALEKILDGK